MRLRSKNRPLANTLLRQRKLSLTKGRMALLLLFLEQPTKVFTVNELRKSAVIKIHRATFYRILKDFEKAHLIRKWPLSKRAWGHQLLTSSPFEYLVHCSSCGLSESWPLLSHGEWEKNLKKKGHQPLSFSFHIEVLCKQCQRKGKNRHLMME